MRSSSAPLRTIASVALLALVAACGDDEGPSVSLSKPSEGDKVAGAVVVAMEADGLTIEAAGEAHDGAGHFHVVADAGCIPSGDAIPRDADHVHFGKGQSDGTIYLEPGEHELCLQAGDGVHAALDATDRVTITVGINTRDEWCAVVGEVDELFSATDSSDDDFAVKQAGYESIRRLLAQLTAAIEQVDADVREGVAAGLDFAAELATAFVEADDMAAAEKALDPLFDGGEDPTEVAQPWILENCGIDINS